MRLRESPRKYKLYTLTQYAFCKVCTKKEKKKQSHASKKFAASRLLCSLFLSLPLCVYINSCLLSISLSFLLFLTFTFFLLTHVTKIYFLSCVTCFACDDIHTNWVAAATTVAKFTTPAATIASYLIVHWITWSLYPQQWTHTTSQYFVCALFEIDTITEIFRKKVFSFLPPTRVHLVPTLSSCWIGLL